MEVIFEASKTQSPEVLQSAFGKWSQRLGNLLSRSVLTDSIRLSGNEYDEKQRELSREGGGGLWAQNKRTYLCRGKEMQLAAVHNNFSHKGEIVLTLAVNCHPYRCHYSFAP